MRRRTDHLRGEEKEDAADRADVDLVEEVCRSAESRRRRRTLDCDDVGAVRDGRARSGEDDEEYVLLEVERAGIEIEGEAAG